MNPELLGGKQECFFCATQPPKSEERLKMGHVSSSGCGFNVDGLVKGLVEAATSI